ncbi:helix-turn-helix domain-containing protein [Terribacillus aidingensis]|uniref:TetR/AcrR family transcriptional regulator n=1 Tax=Terribacillus aidingensis TaxID=586416 RepID=UPI0034503688
MNNKRKIIDASLVLFKEKGYNRTSVEDIVRKCHISKASLYKEFESKKQILLAALAQIHEEIYKKNAEIELTNDSEHEKLTKKVEMIISHHHFNRIFFDSINEAFSKEEIGQLLKYEKPAKLQNYRMYMNNFKLAFDINLNKDSLMNLAIIFEGLYKEWLNIIRCYDEDKADFLQIAKNIVSTMKIIVQTQDYATIKQPSLINQLLYDESQMSLEKENSLLEKIHRMTGIIQNSPIDEEDKSDYLLNITFLQQELMSSRPRKYLLNTVLHYLSQLDELKAIAQSVSLALKESEEIL